MVKEKEISENRSMWKGTEVARYMGDPVRSHSRDSWEETLKTQYFSLANIRTLMGYDCRIKYNPFERISIKEKFAFYTINGQMYPIVQSLEHIAQAINESNSVLNLEDDWDDHGANATNEKTYLRAVLFLINYSKYILDTLKTVIESPDIDIMRDGSISLLWETEKATFLVIFKKNDDLLSYLYGEDKLTHVPFKYAIKNDNQIDDILAIWMSKHLS